jgi:hypothetical protein
MLAKYLARHPDIRQVLLLDAPLWHGDLVAKAEAEGVSEHRLVYSEIQARTLGLRDTDYLSFHSFIYQGRRHPDARWKYPSKADYLSWLGGLFADRDVDPKRAIFWLFPVNPFLGDVVRSFNPKITVTDIVDDQRQQPGISAVNRTAFEANYKELLGMADLAVTNCEPIRHSMAAFGPHIHLVPNACEVEESVTQPDFDIQRLLDIPYPRLGYVGNLESKLDVSLLEYIASSRPDWHIILAGSTHTRGDILKLKRFNNIHFVGVVKYAEACLWIKNFDVALLPHLHTPLTESMNPLKVFVYLSKKVPVVATLVPNTDEMAGLMRIASTPKDFLLAIESVLAGERPEDWENLDERLREHAWDRRVSTLMSWIHQM